MAKKSSYQESMEEMGLGSRGRKMRAFWESVDSSRQKKAGDVVIYPTNGETREHVVNGDWVEEVVCSLKRGTKLTLLKDCTDGSDGIYFTDKGNFFARNFDVVREDHPVYKLAKAKGFI